MVFHGFPMGCPWFSMGFSWFSMVSHGFPWFSHPFSGSSQDVFHISTAFQVEQWEYDLREKQREELELLLDFLNPKEVASEDPWLILADWW